MTERRSSGLRTAGLVLWLGATVTVIATGKDPAVPWLVTLIKGLIVPALALMTAGIWWPRLKDRVVRLMLAAWVLCTAGDVILEGKSESSFLIGLVAFLLGHLAFAGAFAVLGKRGAFRGRYEQWAIAMGLVVVLLSLVGNLREGAGEMFYPVLGYSLVIGVMAFTALRWHPTRHGAAWMVAGALLFMASDALLAWDKFRVELDGGGLYIMSTYALAQCALALGMAQALSHCERSRAEG